MNTFKINFVNKSEDLNSTVECTDDQFILDAAEKQGLELPYSCRTGTCSTCVGKLLEGEIDQSEQSFLDKNQIKAGFVLICRASPISDCIIKTRVEEDLY